MRLIVRRVQPTPGSQLALFATYSYHGCITDREGETLELEADHRRHAEIPRPQVRRGLNHLPSGRFAANGAWLAVQVMAHNLARWTARLGLGEQIVTTKTLRRRFFSIAGRLTRSARRLTLHLPKRWPWENQFRPWHDCEQFHSQPDGAPSAADPPSGPLNVPANSRQVSPRGAPLACPLPNSARLPRAAIIGPVRPPHAVLITIYWNLAWPVRLPLPISPCVNASANPFGGFGVSKHRD